MSIIINSIKMPEAPDEMIELAIYGDGKVIQTGESWRSPEDGKCYYTVTTPEKFGNAVSVPEHGDLIDRNALGMNYIHIRDDGMKIYTQRAIDNAPTIIPADPPKEKTELANKK